MDCRCEAPRERAARLQGAVHSKLFGSTCSAQEQITGEARLCTAIRAQRKQSVSRCAHAKRRDDECGEDGACSECRVTVWLRIVRCSACARFASLRDSSGTGPRCAALLQSSLPSSAEEGSGTKRGPQRRTRQQHSSSHHTTRLQPLHRHCTCSTAHHRPHCPLQ